jgi:hypothetical protein
MRNDWWAEVGSTVYGTVEFPELHSLWNSSIFFLHEASDPTGPWPPHYRSFTITNTPHSVGFLWTSDPPDIETATWQHVTLQTSMPPVGFKLAVPSTERPQTHSLNCVATAIGTAGHYAEEDKIRECEYVPALTEICFNNEKNLQNVPRSVKCMLWPY